MSDCHVLNKACALAVVFMLSISFLGLIADRTQPSIPCSGVETNPRAESSGGNEIIEATTVTHHGDLIIPIGTTMWINQTHFKQDGNVTVYGILILTDSTFEFLQDYYHRYKLTVSGGWLQLFNSVLTVSTKMVAPYVKLNVTIEAEAVVDLEKSTFAFPGTIFLSDLSEMNMKQSRLKSVAVSYANPAWQDENDDGPSIILDSSSAYFEDSRVDDCYQNSWALDKGEMKPTANPSPDNTGERVSNISTTGGGVYLVESGETMYLTNFTLNTDLIEDPINNAVLKATYHTELGFAGGIDLLWNAGSGWKKAFSIENHTSDYTDTYNIYINGGDTLSKLSNLEIFMLNNDTYNITFNRVWVEVFPQYNFNMTAWGQSEITAINTFFDVDWGNPSYKKRNAIVLKDKSSAYLYNVTVNETELSGYKYDSAFITQSKDANAYIYRFAEFRVVENTGMPLKGATVTPEYSGGEPLASVVSALNKPSLDILNYLGRTFVNYNITDEDGRVVLPIISDNISMYSLPNSQYYGSFDVYVHYKNAIAGEGSAVLSIGLPEYPKITISDNFLNYIVVLDTVENPRPDFYPTVNFPPFVIEGSSVLLNATVYNAGNLNATNVLVRFYDGVISSGTQIGMDYTIPKLDMGASEVASTMWTANGTSHNIIVMVDPLGEIPEKNEMNNTASGTIIVKKKPDLAISFSDVSFDPPNSAVKGTPVKILASVHNLGDIDASDVYVGFYVHTDTGLVEIGNATVDVLGGGTNTTSISWNTTVSKMYTIVVKVDPYEDIQDSDRTNNVVSRVYSILSEADLVPSISITPNNPVDNNTVLTIEATVSNVGGVDAFNTQVVFFRDLNGNGALDSGEQIGTNLTMPEIRAGKSNMTSTAWKAVIETSALESYVTLGVIVNGDKSVVEENYDNNNATTTVRIIDRRPDTIIETLEIKDSAGNNSLNSTLLMSSVIINATVVNTNPFFNMNISDVSVWFMDGESVIEVVNNVTLNGTEPRTLTVVWKAGKVADDIGMHTITVYVNPNRTFSERSYANNAASRQIEITEPEMLLFWNMTISEVEVGKPIPIMGEILYKLPTKLGVVNVTVRVAIPGTTVEMVTLYTDSTGAFQGVIPAPESEGTYQITVSIPGTLISEQNTIKVVPASETGFDWFWIIIIVVAIVVVSVIVAVLYFLKASKEVMVECGECGALIPEASRKCPKCGTLFEATMARCSNCKSWIPANAKECPECGVVFVKRDKKSEKTIDDKMKQEYLKFIEKYKETAKRKLGKKYSEESFWKWWKEQPTYISFKDWRAKIEAESKRTITCPSCQTINPASSTICEKCGTQLTERAERSSDDNTGGGRRGDAETPLQSAQETGEQKAQTPAKTDSLCIKCGAKLEGDMKFCQMCGAFQGNAPEKAVKPHARVVYKKVIKPGTKPPSSPPSGSGTSGGGSGSGES